MASASSTPQAERLRSDLSDLVLLAEGDLAVVWRQVKTPAAAKSALMDVLPQLVTVYGSAAATLAAEWYDDLRDSENISRRFAAIVAELPDDLGTEELAGWGVAPLYQPTGAPDWAAAKTLVAGGMQRRILNQSRSTLTGSSTQDPRSHGWQRVGAGECSFCRMLISRGTIYSKATVDFGAHDHCKCSATPAWEDRPQPVRQYEPSQADITDADRARVRAWIAANL